MKMAWMRIVVGAAKVEIYLVVITVIMHSVKLVSKEILDEQSSIKSRMVGTFVYKKLGYKIKMKTYYSLCLNVFHLLALKPNLEKCSIYSNKFFHNFHLFESSLTCSGLWASGLGLARRQD